MLNNHINLSEALEKIISVSELGRGKASKIINNIESNNDSYIIVKNNKPKAVIMSVDEYKEMVEVREKLELLLLSIKRLQSTDPSDYVDYDAVLKEFNLTNEEIDQLTDSVELE
jgi:prevent-host-death family protein